MMVTQDMSLKDIISNSLQKSMSYAQYVDLVAELTENNSTTGPDKSEAMANYTMLNNRRIKRWNKTVKVSEEAQNLIKNSDKNYTWLVLTESWCGDAAHIMPVINKVAELNDNIDYRVILRDENEALMNEFLTNGGKAIPKLIMIDNETDEVVDSYGPRPSVATELVNEFKTKYGKLTPEFKEDLQRWYNKDKGQTIISDMVQFLE